MRKSFYVLFIALMVAIGCTKDGDKTIMFTFEDVPSNYLAGPTSEGANTYEAYTGYHDPLTDIRFDSEGGDYGGTKYWSSGIAISKWTDKVTEGYINQCSVYSDGGHSGSDVFGVSYGSTSVYFNTTDAEYVIEEIWVVNSTYAALSMTNGDSFGAKIFSYADGDWFKLTIKGYKSNSTIETGTVEFYLADFRTATSPGIITNWSKVDLTSLGKVHSIKFELSSSDVSAWGMNTPDYFCIDDIVVRR